MEIKNIELELNKKENEIKELENLKNQAMAQYQVYKNMLQESLKTLTNAGYNPKDLQATKTSIEKDIEENMKKLDDILPDDLIEKYKGKTIDAIIGSTVVKVDLDQDF